MLFDEPQITVDWFGSWIKCKMPWDFAHSSRNSFETRTPVKRKFPGPAGVLLPHNEQSQVKRKQSRVFTLMPQADLQDVPCSQDTYVEIANGPWEQMRKDYELLNERNVYLPDRYNIAWVQGMIKRNMLPNQKAPFLAGVIVKIGLKTTFVTVTLKDATGQISGTIVNTLFENYNSFLTTGSVIVLKQVPVLSTKNFNCYLTITANNLVRIYSQEKVISLRYCTTNDFLAMTQNDLVVEPKKTRVENKKVDANTLLSIEDEKALMEMFNGPDSDLLFGDF